MEEVVVWVVVGSEIEGLGVINAAVGPFLEPVPHIELVLLHELLNLHVKRFDGIIVLLSRVPNKLFVAFFVQVEHEVRAEELSLIKDLVRDHQLPQFLVHRGHVVLISLDQVLVPVGLFPFL